MSLAQVLHVFTETNVTGLELIVCFEKFKWSWIQIFYRNELKVQMLIEVNRCPIVWCSNFFFPLYCWPQMGLKILAKQNPFLWIYFCCMVCDHPTVIHMKSDPSGLNFNWVEIKCRAEFLRKSTLPNIKNWFHIEL